MLLSVLERLALLNILPSEGDFTTLKIVRKLREDLSFNDEEHQALQFKKGGETVTLPDGRQEVVPPGQLHFQDNAVEPKEFSLGAKALSMIVEKLTELDKSKKLSLEAHFTLYEKFLGIEE